MQKKKYRDVTKQKKMKKKKSRNRVPMTVTMDIIA